MLLLLAFAGAARAATYVMPADEVLIGKADSIVRGRVVDVTPDIDPDGGIHTDVTIAVDRFLKGASGQTTIVVRQPGGQVGDRSDVFPGIGSFAAGEEVLLMLDAPAGNANAGPAAWRVTDFALGNFRVLRNADGTEFLRREGLREAFVLSAASTTGTASDPGDPDRDAAGFERFIVSSVKGVTAAADYFLAPQAASPDRTAGFVFLGTPPARRTEFEQGGSITYKDNATGDNGTVCGADHCHGAVAAGMVKWNDTPGSHISLVYGGTDASMTGKCLSQLQNQIQYNDPCNEITNLSGCTGTLALGGFSSSTQSGGTPYCPAMGSPSFQKIVYSKITINNGVGACLSQCDYTEMVAHETGHTLGAGHTSVPGSLMLPSLAHGYCGTLRSDDIAFATCAYPQTELGCDATASKTWGGPPPVTPTFHAGATAGVPPYTYAWTFGDGGTATTAAPSHAYTTASTFTASVTVTDSNSQTCTDSVDVTVLTCKPPIISSVTPKYINGTWRAVVIGTNFKTGTKVEIDSGSGFVRAPTTKYFSTTKVVGRDVGAIWPQGVDVTVRAVNPNGCPSNPISISR